jgi:hypothetical protein
MPGDERGEGGEVGDSAGLLVCSAGFADGGVEVRPRLRLVLGLDEMADGAEGAWVTAMLGGGRARLAAGQALGVHWPSPQTALPSSMSSISWSSPLPNSTVPGQVREGTFGRGCGGLDNPRVAGSNHVPATMPR